MSWVMGLGLGLAGSSLIVAVFYSVAGVPVEATSPFFWLMNLDIAIVGVGLMIYGAVRDRR